MRLRDFTPLAICLVIAALIVMVFGLPTWVLANLVKVGLPWTLAPVIAFVALVLWLTRRWYDARYRR